MLSIMASLLAPGAETPLSKNAPPYLLYVGSRAGYKNFGLLLEAFSRSGLAANYRLLAVGGGSLTAAEQQRIASLHLTGSITVIPKAEDAAPGPCLPRRSPLYLSQSV